MQDKHVLSWELGQQQRLYYVLQILEANMVGENTM